MMEYTVFFEIVKHSWYTTVRMSFWLTQVLEMGYILATMHSMKLFVSICSRILQLSSIIPYCCLQLTDEDMQAQRSLGNLPNITHVNR